MSVLSPVFFLLASLSLFLRSSLTSINLVLSVSLLKPKCCCEGREPWKSEWPPHPRPSLGRAEGGENPGLGQCCWTLPGESDRALDATLGPEASAFSFSLVSLSHPGNETVGLGHGGSRDSAVAGVWGALSGQRWSGCPSYPGTHDGAWCAIEPSLPECKRLR